MVDSGLHRVRRLRWQARTPNAADAFALQSLLHRRSEDVGAALEQAFASLDTTHENWHLPSLTLRLDASSLAQIDADLPVLVADALRLALQAALTTAAAPGADSKSAGDAGAKADRSAARRTTTAESARAALRHYLASASLPWALAGLGAEAQQQALHSAAQAALASLLAQASASSAAGAALSDLIGAPTAPFAARIGALLRWLPLISHPQRQRWLAHSPRPTGLGLSPAQVDAWFALLTSPDAALEWLALWLVWPTTALTGIPPGGNAPDVTALANWISDLPPDGGHSAARSSLSVSAAEAHDPPLSAVLRRALGDHPGMRTVTASLPHRPSTAPISSVADAPETQLVPLAGLLLLHPYLSRLLKGCGLLDDTGRNIPDAALPRACALLHGLACGDAEAAEHQLPLVKLLLGRAPDFALTSTLPRPAAADQEEIDALLAAVRSHWTALGNTSAEGLRLSFLQRRGLLRKAEGAWQLTMQAEGFDVLLGLLPWSISLVKLPWMPLPLMVEWQAP